ncbi:hypothetical protein [Rhodobacter capsulatus]|jgi:hypothetical protein|uniref:Uncharacterized protein n=1 Tax=Rhodobacter capsulatus (strain ATCC BAA-309 / NBRC 16581 / SB1003) TaxID=272942 RepID=D5AQT3_RHOCB|nr:hypothetical protein [Rhodobacter capsulatus]YP_004934686.1 hypothetical protein RcapMu43 [Rhodobacter phage RcapMu]AFK66585.1 hypothetical protein RHZG_00079 [Rhodobacter phage RcNL1]ADE84739.1 conserved hypothetical protein [Rhodobacter capsulatus SB 1003]AER29977.1 hypothetical protein RcapMu43 [Rhodobacter phage RcapMu]ETD02210.1 hypothetical protein U714_06090 [Rhodobacter capsulatus DE442]ETD78294.1 hypothetical protein U717_06095 [Rhodobacter capsulatus R121]
MEDKIEVVLIGPAKIRDAVKRPGDKVRVTDAEREQLRAAGVLAEDAAGLIENADVAADLNAVIVDWQARALSAEAQLKLLEARVIELQGGPLPVAEDADGTWPIENESAPVAPVDPNTRPVSGTEDSLEPVQAEEQAEVQPVEEDPEAAKTTPKAGRGKAKG